MTDYCNGVSLESDPSMFAMLYNAAINGREDVIIKE